MNVNVDVHSPRHGNGSHGAQSDSSTCSSSGNGQWALARCQSQAGHTHPHTVRPPPLLLYSQTNVRNNSASSSTSIQPLPLALPLPVHSIASASSSTHPQLSTPLASSTISLLLPLDSTLHIPGRSSSGTPIIAKLIAHEARQDEVQPLLLDGMDSLRSRNRAGNNLTGTAVNGKGLQQVVLNVNQCMNLNMNMTSSKFMNMNSSTSYPSSSPSPSPSPFPSVHHSLSTLPAASSSFNSYNSTNTKPVNGLRRTASNYSSCFDVANSNAASAYVPSVYVSPSSSPVAMEPIRSSHATLSNYSSSVPSSPVPCEMEEPRVWVCPLRCGHSYVNAAVEVLRSHLANCPMNGIEAAHSAHPASTRKRDREEDLPLQSHPLQSPAHALSHLHSNARCSQLHWPSSCCEQSASACEHNHNVENQTLRSSSSSAPPPRQAQTSSFSCGFGGSSNSAAPSATFSHQSAHQGSVASRAAFRYAASNGAGVPADWQQAESAGYAAHQSPMLPRLSPTVSYSSDPQQVLYSSTQAPLTPASTSFIAVPLTPGGGPFFGLRAKKARRAGAQLKEKERWYCPMSCGAFYKNTSTKSIRKHLNGGCPLVFHTDSLDVDQLRRMAKRAHSAATSMSSSGMEQDHRQQGQDTKDDIKQAFGSRDDGATTVLLHITQVRTLHDRDLDDEQPEKEKKSKLKAKEERMANMR